MSDDAKTTINVDTLVATYSALGARQRRRRRLRGWLGATLVALIGTVTFNAHRLGWSFEDVALRLKASSKQALHGLFEDELAALDEQRVALEAERRRLESRAREFAARLESFESRAAELQSTRDELRASRAALETALERVEAEREVFAAVEPRPDVAEEVAAIRAEREALVERRRTFAAQDAELDRELDSLSQQREDLRRQRESMERQRRELEAVLESAGLGTALVPPSAVPSAVPDAYDSGEAMAMLEGTSLALGDDQIGEGSLGDMRAGIRLGDGMNISLGLTRTASINGIEEIQQTFDLGVLGAGMDLSSIEGLGHLVIQSGSANTIDPGVLDPLGFGTFIQNDLDGQRIRTETIYDLSIHDVARTIQGLAAGHALSDSLGFQQ